MMGANASKRSQHFRHHKSEEVVKVIEVVVVAEEEEEEEVTCATSRPTALHRADRTCP